MMVWVLSFVDRRRHDTVSRDKGYILRGAKRWRDLGRNVRVDRMPLSSVGKFDPWKEPVNVRLGGPLMSKKDTRGALRWIAAQHKGDPKP